MRQYTFTTVTLCKAKLKKGGREGVENNKNVFKAYLFE